MKPFDRILYPVDLSEQCGLAAPFVKAMAERFHSEITMLHVMEPIATMYAPPEAAAYAAIANSEELRASRQMQFDQFLTREFCTTPMRREFLEGEPGWQIVDYAHENKFDLIMLPTRGYGVFRRFLLGSVAAKVLHDADCPVWTGVHTPELLAHDPRRLQRIVCAISEDQRDKQVLRWVSEFATVTGAEVHLLHAVAHSSNPEPNFRAAHQKIAQAQIDVGTHFEVSIREGRPATAVHLEAQERQADLIVIGRGAHQLGRLRPDDYEIVREAPCPVISV